MYPAQGKTTVTGIRTRIGNEVRKTPKPKPQPSRLPQLIQHKLFELEIANPLMMNSFYKKMGGKDSFYKKTFSEKVQTVSDYLGTQGISFVLNANSADIFYANIPDGGYRVGSIAANRIEAFFGAIEDTFDYLKRK